MSKHRVEDADFFVTNLSPTEVKFVIAELSVLRQQQRFSLSQPPRFSRIIGVLAGRRFFNILFPLDSLRRYFQTLSTGKEADAEVAERAINILSQSMTPSARRIQIVGCPITPPPPEKEKLCLDRNTIVPSLLDATTRSDIYITQRATPQQSGSEQSSLVMRIV